MATQAWPWHPQLSPYVTRDGARAVDSTLRNNRKRFKRTVKKTMSGEQQVNLETMTNTVMLDGLRDAGNRSVWGQFVGRYQPMILKYARRFGLTAADAEDAAQQAIIAFCTAYQEGKYDRDKGRLRVWLFGIARNQIRNVIKKKGRRREVQVVNDASETDFFVRETDDDTFERIWEEEWRDAVLRQCLDEVRKEFDAKTVQAFEQFAWKGKPAQQVADELGVTANAVFIAKHRIMKRIRELLPQMESVW